MEAIRHAYSNLFFITDRQSVWQYFERRVWRRRLHEVCNPQVWKEIGQLVEGSERVIQVVKTESHLKERDIALGYGTRFLATANGMAGRRANEAASLVQVDEGIVKRAEALEALAVLVLRRAARAAIAAAAASRCEGKGVRISTASGYCPTATAIRRSGHSLSFLAGTRTLICTTCKQALPGRRVIAWLQLHPCLLREGAEADCSGTQYKVTVAGREAHPSHSLAWSQSSSYWYCIRCRGTAALAMRSLGRECTSQQGFEGRRALKRIAKDLMPWQPKEGSCLNVLRLQNDRAVRPEVLSDRGAAKRFASVNAKRRKLASGPLGLAAGAGGRAGGGPDAAGGLAPQGREHVRAAARSDSGDHLHPSGCGGGGSCQAGTTQALHGGPGSGGDVGDFVSRAWMAGRLLAAQRRVDQELVGLSSGRASGGATAQQRLDALARRVRARLGQAGQEPASP